MKKYGIWIVIAIAVIAVGVYLVAQSKKKKQPSATPATMITLGSIPRPADPRVSL